MEGFTKGTFWIIGILAVILMCWMGVSSIQRQPIYFETLQPMQVTMLGWISDEAAFEVAARSSMSPETALEYAQAHIGVLRKRSQHEEATEFHNRVKRMLIPKWEQALERLEALNEPPKPEG